MADARLQADWVRDAALACLVVNRNGWTRTPIDPVQVIPPAFRPPREPVRKRTAEEIAEESRFAWVVLDHVFGGK
ncbi:hypothetical protein VT84_37675 [Gemmata sp. SH-PL17]|uniref:hypothetical protein n=1 Tax=Gemmata sp. SH-PL17 TaxID=1630693 RepID=UPI00078E1E98|nr:hypothetical protein [Gemmata sp. SH-PL17]AMV30183.1 hypothetical protein VT84_37675 [Gemmata sp. SH-PL17]